MRVIDLLDYGMSRMPQRPCVVDDRIRYTHAEVRVLSHRVANGLHAAGLRRGARVAEIGRAHV